MTNLFNINNQALINNKSDFFGAFASGLCLIHCLATPLIFAVQVCSTSCCASGPLWWTMIDYIFLLVSFVAIYYSAKNTSLKWMKPMLYISWTLLALFILNERFELFQLPQMINYAPALSLVGLHLYNRKYCQCSEDRCCADHLQ